VTPTRIRALATAAVAVFFLGLAGIAIDASFGGDAGRDLVSAGATQAVPGGTVSAEEAVADGAGTAPSGSAVGGAGATPGGRATRSTGAVSGRTVPTGLAVPRIPSHHPGVTDTEVRIGIAVINDGAQVFDAFGIKGVAVASPAEAEARTTAIFNWINAHGGVAGRKLVPRYFEYSYFTGTFAAQSQAVCTHFTEDDPVLAVLSLNAVRLIADCLKQHDTMFLDAGNSEAYDAQALGELGAHYYRPFELNLSRLDQQIDGLARVGFLTAKNKIGVLRWDLPQATRAMQQAVRPALATHALRLTDEYAYNYVGSLSDLSQTSAESSNAVLRFRTAGIDRVVFIGSQAVFPLFFGAEAESQGYKPDYGWSSLDVPSSMPGNMPAHQLLNSQGVGWNIGFDLNLGGGQPFEQNAQYKACAAALDAGGQAYPNDGFACDYYFLLQAGLNRAKEVSPAGFRAALDGMASAFQPAQSHVLFRSGRYEGVDAVRNFAYDDGCSCFKYTSPLRPTP